MSEPWDRSKQTYFIVRRGNPWHVRSVDGTRHVADWPAHFGNEELTRQVCFAESDDKVREIVAGMRPKAVVHHMLLYQQGAITEYELFARVRENDGRDCLPPEVLPDYDKWVADHSPAENMRTFHMGSFVPRVVRVIKPAYRDLTAREVQDLGDVNPFALMEYALYHLGQAISVADGFSVHKAGASLFLQATDVDTTDNKTGTVSQRDLLELRIDPNALEDLVIWEQFKPGPTAIDPELPNDPKS